MYLVVLYLGLRVKVYQPDYIRFLGLGFASFVNVVGTILALQYISASRYALFQPSIPCIASVISIALRFEAFTSLKAAGIACAVAGAVLVETWRTGNSCVISYSSAKTNRLISPTIRDYRQLIIDRRVEYHTWDMSCDRSMLWHGLHHRLPKAITAQISTIFSDIHLLRHRVMYHHSFMYMLGVSIYSRIILFRWTDASVASVRICLDLRHSHQLQHLFVCREGPIAKCYHDIFHIPTYRDSNTIYDFSR